MWLCSQIGRPIDDPWSISVDLILAPGANLRDMEKPIRELVARELGDVENFTGRLCRGELSVC